MAVRVLPSACLFFPCDEARLDLADGKWSLKNPWHTVWMPTGVREKFCQKEIWLYAQLTDGIGEFYFTVELRDFESGTVLGRSHPPERREFHGGEQSRMTELVFHMLNVPIPKPGLYVFKLIANHAEVEGGTAYLRVFPGE